MKSRVLNTDKLTTVLGLSALVLESISELGVYPAKTKSLAYLAGAAFCFYTNKLPKPTLEAYKTLK